MNEGTVEHGSLRAVRQQAQTSNIGAALFPAQAQRGQTYDLIRRSALRLIAQKGFAAMSMRQLADLVGIQAGSLYRYFPSKHCLLFELLCEHYDDLLCAWQQARPCRAPADRGLVAFIEHHLRWHEWRHQQGALIDPGEVRNLAGNERERVVQLRRRYHEQLGQLIDSGVREGCFRCQDVPLFADAILAVLQSAGENGSRRFAERCADYRALVLKLLS